MSCDMFQCGILWCGLDKLNKDDWNMITYYLRIHNFVVVCAG